MITGLLYCFASFYLEGLIQILRFAYWALHSVPQLSSSLWFLWLIHNCLARHAVGEILSLCYLTYSYFNIPHVIKGCLSEERVSQDILLPIYLINL